MRQDIYDQCRNRWSSILSLFGVDASYLTGRQAPCPICKGGKDRFRFDNRGGDGTWICNACGAGKGATLIAKLTGMSFEHTYAAIRERLGETREEKAKPVRDPAKTAEAVRRLYDSGTVLGIEADMATQYLNGRGLTGPHPFCLRFVSSCPVRDHSVPYLPAMLAPVMSVDRELVAVHRTYLEDGRKADMPSPRKVMGKLPDGCAIRLGETTTGKLAVAEGIETALAVTQRFGITCWSVMSTTMMAKFIPPAGLKEFHVFADNDRNFAGQAAAYALAHRIAVMADGPLVGVHIPPKLGQDWADGLHLRAVS